MLLISSAWFMFKDFNSWVSAIFGGIAWIIPNFYFVNKIFRNSKQRSLNVIAKDFYVGEFVQLFLSGILIVLFIKIYTIVLIPFVITFIGVVMTSFLLPVVYAKSN
jgi:F0F1-type ATP synthase assembly protein I